MMMKPSWPSGKKTYSQVQAELLPFAERQRAVDDLPPAEVEDRRLPQVGDQEDEREEEGEGARHLDLLVHQVVCGNVEPRLLLAARARTP